ncbi:hypothetical protein HDU97_007457 [Phlyctochytrium planicorne]|nr:hypothetical protein HDU97_007457 [Phlyctochytrium planicorne]
MSQHLRALSESLCPNATHTASPRLRTTIIRRSFHRSLVCLFDDHRDSKPARQNDYSSSRGNPRERKGRSLDGHSKKIRPGRGVTVGEVRGGYIQGLPENPVLSRTSRDASLKREGEIRPPDFVGFEDALKLRDRVAAWLKFKDLCFSEESSRLTSEHLHDVMALLVKHDPPKLNLMVSAMSFSKQLGIRIDISHYNLLLDASGKLKDSASAREFLKEAVAAGLKPNLKTYNQFLSLYAHERNVEGAIVFFDRMIDEGIKPDVDSFNSIMSAALKAKKLKIVHEYKEKLASHGIPADSGTYEILIRSHGAFGDVKAALEAYDEMLKAGIPANAVVLTSLVKVLADSGNVASIDPILKDAEQHGFEKDIFFYTTLIYAYFKARDTRTAVQKFEEMIASGCSPDITAFQNLIAGFSQAGMPSKAEEAMVFMKSGRSSVPSNIYRIVMVGYFEAGMVSDGVRIFEQLRADGGKPTTIMYNILLKGLADDYDEELMSKYWEEWRRSIEEFQPNPEGYVEPPPKPDAMSFTTVLEAYIRCSRIEKATALLKEMMAKRLEPHPKCYIDLVGAHARSGKYLAAAEVVLMMRKSATAKKSNVLSVIMSYSSQFEALIKTLATSAESLEGDTSSFGLRGNIPKTLKDFAESGLNLANVTEAKAKRQIAFELYRELLAAKIKMQEATYRYIIEGYHKSGELVPAIKVWTTFRNEYADRLPEPETVATILACVRDWGRAETSKAIIKVVENEGLPLNNEGRLTQICILAKLGMASEVNRSILDMVNAGMLPTPVTVREIEAYLKMSENPKAQAEVMGFLEENWPAAFALDE